MKNIISKKKLIITILAIVFALSSAMLLFTTKKASAEYSIDNVTLEMVKGACVRMPDENYTTGGLRYIMTMSKTDYESLMENVGEDKTYQSAEFGIFIAPSYYNETYALNQESNVNGASAKYGWLTSEEKAENIAYADSVAGKAGLYQIINTESSVMIEYSADTTKYAFYGSVVNLKQENMLTEYECAGYIRYTDTEGAHYKFATKNDNARSMTYIAQKAIENNADTEDGILNTTYVQPFSSSDSTYKVNVYVRNESGDYVEDTTKAYTKTGKVGASVDLSSETMSGYNMATNSSAKKSGVVYANNKSEFSLYYRSKDVFCDFEKDDGSRAWDFSSNQIVNYAGTVTEETGNTSNHVLTFQTSETWGAIVNLKGLTAQVISSDYSDYDFFTMDVLSDKDIKISLFGSPVRKVSDNVKTKIIIPLSSIDSSKTDPLTFNSSETFTASIDNIGFGKYDENTYNEYQILEKGSNVQGVTVAVIADPTNSGRGDVISYVCTDEDKYTDADGKVQEEGSCDGLTELIGFSEYLAWGKSKGYDVFSFDYYVTGTASAQLYGKTLTMNIGSWTQVNWIISDLQALTDTSSVLWIQNTDNAFYFDNFTFKKSSDVIDFEKVSTSCSLLSSTNGSAPTTSIIDATVDADTHGKVFAYSCTGETGIWDIYLVVNTLSELINNAKALSYTQMKIDVCYTSNGATVLLFGTDFKPSAVNTWETKTFALSDIDTSKTTLNSENFLFWMGSSGAIMFDNITFTK